MKITKFKNLFAFILVLLILLPIQTFAQEAEKLPGKILWNSFYKVVENVLTRFVFPFIIPLSWFIGGLTIIFVLVKEGLDWWKEKRKGSNTNYDFPEKTIITTLLIVATITIVSNMNFVNFLFSIFEIFKQFPEYIFN
jgi:hypothetical protein